jgi:Condensation domain/Phosphopantetheine attachment site
MNEHRPYVSFPLSFSQRRLCVLEAIDGTGITFCSHRCFRILGQFDLDALKKALELLIARHEPLRTTFVIDDSATDGLGQRIFQKIDVPLDVHDLYAAEDGEEMTTREIQSEIRRPFLTEGGPLWRVVVWTLGPQVCWLLFSFHELVADGWSEGIFLRDLSKTYSLICEGQDARLPKLTIQYADWASWQRKRLTEDRERELLNWWKKELEGASYIAQLPFVSTKTPHCSIGGRIERLLPESRMRALIRLAARQKTTLYVLLMTVYGLTLASYTGHNDLLVGTPEANRERPEAQNILGFFLNTLAIRIKTKENLTFHELAQSVQSTVLEAFAHKDMPFDLLIAYLNPRRHEYLTPVVQTCFTYRPLSQRGALNLTDCEIEEIGLSCGTSRFALTAGVDERHEGSRIWALFDKTLLAETTVAEILSLYDRLLSTVVDQPNRRLSALLASSGSFPSREHPAAPWRSNNESNDATQSKQHCGDSVLVRQLSTVMADVLRVDHVEPHDNFFALGGYSLLAHQFLSQINRLLKIEVPLRMFLAYATIIGLVNSISM